MFKIGQKYQFWLPYSYIFSHIFAKNSELRKIAWKLVPNISMWRAGARKLICAKIFTYILLFFISITKSQLSFWRPTLSNPCNKITHISFQSHPLPLQAAQHESPNFTIIEENVIYSERKMKKVTDDCCFLLQYLSSKIHFFLFPSFFRTLQIARVHFRVSLQILFTCLALEKNWELVILTRKDKFHVG